MKGDGGWFKSRLGEAIAIILSILIAFAIDAGWDVWQERREEAEVLDALWTEYRSNLAELEETLARQQRSTHLARWGLEATAAQVGGLSPAEAAEILQGLAAPFTFDPNLGTTEALRSSGRLSLLRDTELQRLLMDFATRTEDAREDRVYLETWANEVWRAEVRLGGPWIEVAAFRSLFPSVDAPRSPTAPTADDLRQVRNDPVFPGLIRRYQVTLAIYRSELQDQREVILEILDRLPRPVGAPDPGFPHQGVDVRRILMDPRHPAWSEAAPDTFDARFETTAGPFTLRVYRAWAPIGADRFWNLARHGFYDDARFHRVVPGFITQFGISGDPAVDAVWYDRGMPDDPVVASNVRGSVAFAFTEPGTRSTQLYVNMVDNVRLDSAGFAPVGRVISGMQWAVDSIYGGYGEASGGGVRRGNQAPLVEGGNAYIDREYPELDRILGVSVERTGG